MLCSSPGELIFSDLSDYLFNTEGSWSLIRCRGCGLIWIDPKPAAPEIDKFYDNYYTHDEISNTWFVNAVTRLIPAVQLGYWDSIESVRWRIWATLLSLIGPLREAGYSSLLWLPAESRGSILDVGCGSGIFLSHMKHFGWDAYGFEPDYRAARIAGEKLGPGRIASGGLDKAGYKENSFDVVTMSHVVEHLPDPAGVLDLCRRILKPGGLLTVVTPNPGSLGRRIFGRHWRGWEPPRHIHIFGSAALGRLAARSGFTVKSVRTPSTASYYNSVNSMLIKKLAGSGKGHGDNPTLWMKIKGLFFWGFEYLLTRTGLKLGEELVLFAEKKN